MTRIPTFAILGEPNAGKTTVVATLSEMDNADISPIPGTTKVCRTFPVIFDDKEVMRFIDTPGFENPLETLEWFEAHEHDGCPLAEKFRNEHPNSKEFERECELMKPLAEGAAVIYVVDGSEAVNQKDRAHMEILRLASPPARPRVAVINSHHDNLKHIEQWKNALGKTFNIIHTFNAHSATFTDRLELLRDIRGVNQEWKPTLDACIAAFQRNWDERIAQSAEAICTLLKDCLACFESEQLARGETDDGVSAKVEKRVKDKIRENEERFRKGIRRSFRHTRISGPTLDLNLDDDLFSKETVSVFGMSKYLLAGVSASITATLAAMGDVAAGGASLGLFAAGGFVLGGIAGYWGANRLISVEVPSLLRPILPGRMKTHGRCITARPSPLSNLPWVLINRSIEFFHWASTWSHGRTDQPAAIIQADVRKASNTNNWTKEQRETAQRFIALALATIETGAMEKLKQYMPGKKLTPETVEREMRETLIAVLKTMTGFKR